MADINQQILSQALGGQFDAASFYRAKAKGFSDRDIINALNASPGSATGQMKFIAQNYEKALSQTSPSKTRGGSYAAGGQEWGPQLMVTPNKYNPLLGGRDPYGGRFATSTTGDDPRQAFAKRGMSFSYGPANAQEYLNEQYWKGQVNTNPEVNYRWNTGDSLDPNLDIGNQYGRLAEMDLAGQGGSEEYKKLARERAEAYEKQGAAGINNWRTGLHEEDPRFAQIAQDPTEYAKYFTETSPSKGTSEAARWFERALSGEVMTPLSGNAKENTPFADQEFKNIKKAYESVKENDQRFGVENIQALGENTDKNFFDTVKSLRAQRDKSGETGGVLTREAREKFREIKERRERKEAPREFDSKRSSVSSPKRKEESRQINVDKIRKAKDLARKSKDQRQRQRQRKNNRR